MKVFVGQIYIKAGVVFPFSLRFQQWLGNALSERVEVSEQFCKKFGADFALGIRVSAKEHIDRAEHKGPTVFKRDKNVEFTIFLPHGPSDYHEPKAASLLLLQLLESIVLILQQLELDTVKIVQDVDHLQAEFLDTPDLLKPRKIPSSNAR